MFALVSLAALVPAAPPFTLKDGDRVVWIGNTLAEREQRYGYWEAALLARFPDKGITFRNLGGSGDTVLGDARAGFDTPAQGFQRLVGLTLELKPTVILVSYGTNEAFAGPAGLPGFVKGLDRLLDALTPARAEIVLVSPIGYETPNPTLPSRDADLKAYAAAIGDVAARRNLRFADLGGAVDRWRAAARSPDHPPLTDNGMHLSEAGYRITAPLFLAALGVGPASESHAGADPERLRTAVVAKNELFFHRWRPQNETYLFGFRKHEQGKNAKEIAQFDPLVDAADKDVNRLKKNPAR